MVEKIDLWFFFSPMNIREREIARASSDLKGLSARDEERQIALCGAFFFDGQCDAHGGSVRAALRSTRRGKGIAFLVRAAS